MCNRKGAVRRQPPALGATFSPSLLQWTGTPKNYYKYSKYTEFVNSRKNGLK